MTGQGWIVTAAAAVAAVACVRKFLRSVLHRGRDTGCCRDGVCGRQRRRPQRMKSATAAADVADHVR